MIVKDSFKYMSSSLSVDLPKNSRQTIIIAYYIINQFYTMEKLAPPEPRSTFNRDRIISLLRHNHRNAFVYFFHSFCHERSQRLSHECNHDLCEHANRQHVVLDDVVEVIGKKLCFAQRRVQRLFRI